jgi:hypothetical protein
MLEVHVFERTTQVAITGLVKLFGVRNNAERSGQMIAQITCTIDSTYPCSALLTEIGHTYLLTL